MEHQKKFNRINLKHKIDILNRLDYGESVSALAREYGAATSSISYIKKNKESILRYASSVERGHGNLSKTTTQAAQNRDLENSVYAWFRQKQALGGTLSGPIICEKALTFNEKLGGGSPNFKASSGWLKRFKNRHGIRDLTVQAGKQSVDAFRGEFQKYVADGGYNFENIYNADETGLLWKSLPSKTLAARREVADRGREVNEDRVTAMVCTNATGTHKLPLLVIGRYEKPRRFKNVTCVHVAYRQRDSDRTDRDVFMDWYTDHFIPSVKTRQATVGWNGKVILLLDNAPSHPAAKLLNAVDDNFEVAYFPKNATNAVQPMDQGIKEKTKRAYRMNLLRELSFGDNAESVVAFFSSLRLRDCVRMLANAWASLTEANLRNAWGQILPVSEKNTVDGNDAGNEIDISDFVTLLRSIPSCRDCDEDDTGAWLNADADDPGWEIIGDDDIIELVRRKNDLIEEPAVGEPADEAEEIEHTAREILDAVRKIENWLKRQPSSGKRAKRMCLDAIRNLAESQCRNKD